LAWRHIHRPADAGPRNGPRARHHLTYDCRWGGGTRTHGRRIMRSLPSYNAVSSCTNSTALVIHDTHRTSSHRHPVHEPVHGRAGITVIWITERDRDGRRTVWQAALSWPSPGSSFPPAGGAPVQSTLRQRRARRPDRPHLADAVPEAGRRAAAHLAKLTARSPAQNGWRSPNRAHMAEQTAGAACSSAGRRTPPYRSARRPARRTVRRARSGTRHTATAEPARSPRDRRTRSHRSARRTHPGGRSGHHIAAPGVPAVPGRLVPRRSVRELRWIRRSRR
jgi:hypothetical protein